MSVVTLHVDRAGYAVVQDLGRSGCGDIGVAANGALDQDAARTANVLVGNWEGAPLIETTGSELAVTPDADTLVAVTGAADRVLVDGHRQPPWETLSASAGSRLVVPAAARGYRSYLAVNGTLRARRALGSVSPDPLLGVGTRLQGGDSVRVDSAHATHAPGPLGRLFRMGAARPPIGEVLTVQVTEGPDLPWLARGRAALSDPFRLLPQSDHVGLRLGGTPAERAREGEILSRGVPIGAVEVPPTGEVIVLLRGRLVTAGYPVVAVVTTASLDLLAQARPGDAVKMTFCDIATAHAALRQRNDVRVALAGRVQAAFAAKGLAGSLLHGGGA